MLKRSSGSTSVALVLVLAALAVAQDAGGETKAPWNPYATAKKGDWVLHRMTIEGMGPEPARSLALATVAEVKGDEVSIKSSEKSSDGSARNRTLSYPAGKEITVAALIDAKDKKVEGVTISDDKKTVGGKEFACKKITCTVKDEESTSKLELWLATDVHAGGLVAAHLVMKMGANEAKFDAELVGHGSEGKTDWGQTLAEAEKK